MLLLTRDIDLESEINW